MTDEKDELSFYEFLDRHDILTRLGSSFESGNLWIDKDTKKITYKKGIPWNVPWIYTRPHPKTKCFADNEVLFETFKSLMGQPASGCQSCWKIVVQPRNIEELFKLRDLQRDDCDLYCKCGIEVRKWVPRNYGGYFYTRSQEEGQKVYEEVRKLVDEKISPDVNVLLKRGCTEMEHYFGDSSEWKVTEQSLHWEKQIYAVFDIPPADQAVPQPEIVRIRVLRNWIDYAYSIGDTTYKKYTNGKPLSPEYVTYHKEEEE